ncbi:hypothetical protein BD289DRAFT_36388 [Coniella lustricola]|uniref:PAC domain-containing protein n=1 Tax=Coniella lustricola TaxID=2025994 RepID=A0A2T3A2A4_9PEZI|nr:hypothetical protein BD289DRAFT_36388 [Coniella lustricola]
MADSKDDKPDNVYGRRASIVRVFHVPANIVRHLRHSELAQGGRQSPRPRPSRPIPIATSSMDGGGAGTAGNVARQQQANAELQGKSNNSLEVNGNETAGGPTHRRTVNVMTREVILPNGRATTITTTSTPAPGSIGTDNDEATPSAANKTHHESVPGIPLRRSNTRTPLGGNPVFSSLIPLVAPQQAEHDEQLRQQQKEEPKQQRETQEQLQAEAQSQQATQPWLQFDPYSGGGGGGGEEGSSNTRLEKTFFECRFQDHGLYPVSERSWESSLPDVSGTEGVSEPAGTGMRETTTTTERATKTNTSQGYIHQYQQQQQQQQQQKHPKPAFPPSRHPEDLTIPDQSIELPASPVVYMPPRSASSTPQLIHLHRPRSGSQMTTTATATVTATAAGDDRCCSLTSLSCAAAAGAGMTTLPPLQARRLDDAPGAGLFLAHRGSGRGEDEDSSFDSQEEHDEEVSSGSSTTDSFDLSVPSLSPPVNNIYTNSRSHYSHNYSHASHNHKYTATSLSSFSPPTSPTSISFSSPTSSSSPRHRLKSKSTTRTSKSRTTGTPPPPILLKPFNLEHRSEQLFSVAHLHIILSDAGFLERFRQYVVQYRSRRSAALVGYAVDALKALRAMEWMNAVMRAGLDRDIEEGGLFAGLLSGWNGKDKEQQQQQQQGQQRNNSNNNNTRHSQPDEITTNEPLRQKAAAAFEILARDELPAYITHVWGEIVEASLRQRVMGRMSAHLVERSEGLAEVFCLADPARADCPIVFASEEFHRTTHFGPDHVLGRNCRFLQGPKTNFSATQRISEMMKAALMANNNDQATGGRATPPPAREHYETILNYRRDGLPFMNLVMVTPLLDARGKVRYFLGAQVDVSGLAKDCSGLESLRRLVDREEKDKQVEGAVGCAPEDWRGVKTKTPGVGEAFRSLAEMLSSGEVETVRLCGGRMQSEAQTQSQQHGVNVINSANQPWAAAATPQSSRSIASPTPAKASFREVTDALGNVTISVGAEPTPARSPKHLRNNNSSLPSAGYTSPIANTNHIHNNGGNNNTLKDKRPININNIPPPPPPPPQRPIFQNYLVVRPYPSLRILFASPSLRIPGMLQSQLMSRVGGSQRIKDELEGAFAAGRSVTAKVRWISGGSSSTGSSHEKGKAKVKGTSQAQEDGKNSIRRNRGGEKSASTSTRTSTSTGSTSIASVASVASASSSSCCSASTSTAKEEGVVVQETNTRDGRGGCTAHRYWAHMVKSGCGS